MPFIGNTPNENFTSFAKQDLTGVTGSPAKRGYTLSHAVANANEIEVFVNNVRQEPTESYTVNGTGLTMTGDVETSDDFYIIYLGKAIQTTVPPDGSVSTAKIADSAVTSAKLDISATNKPSFKAYLSSDQAQTQNSVTQVVYNTEIYDSNSTYDTSNGRFTPAVVGKYFVNASIGFDGADANGRVRVYIYKNGSNYAMASYGLGDTNDDGGIHQVSAIVELDADDYVDARVQYTGTDNVVGQQVKTWFEAFKLIGA